MNSTRPRPTRDRWGGVWLATLRDPAFRALSRSAVQVYLVIACYATRYLIDGHIHYVTAWPSHETIAEHAGYSVAHTKRALKELRDGAWIEWKRTRGSCEYSLKRTNPLAYLEGVDKSVDNPGDNAAA